MYTARKLINHVWYYLYIYTSKVIDNGFHIKVTNIHLRCHLW